MSAITTLAASPTVQLADHWHDDDWDGPGVWWPIFPITWLLIVGAIVTTIVILRRRHWARHGIRSGEARLAERYANGEIDEQEYKDRLAVLKEQGR
jgi:putative membrane protein